MSAELGTLHTPVGDKYTSNLRIEKRLSVSVPKFQKKFVRCEVYCFSLGLDDRGLMLIDSTDLMYGTFQSCRHALRHTAVRLNLLAETLEIVKQQGTLVVDVPDNWVTKYGLQSHKVTATADQERNDALSPANQNLFSLIYIGTHELQQLSASDSTHAVRCLGYAFHNIPALLRKPDDFHPHIYMGSFQIVSYHWAELSLEMRQAFSEVLGLELEDASTLANSDGFAFEAWRSSSQQ